MTYLVGLDLIDFLLKIGLKLSLSQAIFLTTLAFYIITVGRILDSDLI